jgi:flagellar protein FlbD
MAAARPLLPSVTACPLRLYVEYAAMVTVTRLDGSTIVVNAELIESIEAVPDTIITLTTQKKVTVKEPMMEVVERVIRYQRKVRVPLEDRAVL